MNTQRALQFFGRTLVYSRSSEILQQGVRSYNSPNVHPGFSFTGTNFPSVTDERLLVNNYVARTQAGSFVKVLTKKLSTGTFVYTREFSDDENQHAHSVLCSLPSYQSTTVDITDKTPSELPVYSNSLTLVCRNWEHADVEELVQAVSDYVTYGANPNDPQCTNLCKALCSKMQQLNDDQVMRTLASLKQWSQKEECDNITMLKHALDKACAFRIRRWSIPHIFLVADYWYALKMCSASIFYARLVTFIGSRIRQISHSELVQFMFYVNLNRSFGPIKWMHLHEKVLESVDVITIEELGIIAMGFFKTKESVSNSKLIDAVVKKLYNNIDHVSSPCLGAILKLLRSSLPSTSCTLCYQILDFLLPHLNKFSTFTLLQVALLGNNLLVFHPDVINSIGERFGKDVSSLRLKDLERFTYVLMLYKYIPPSCPNILELIVNELRKPERIVELNHFPQCFISCVCYLTNIGVFPYDLISAALQPSMLGLLEAQRSYSLVGREISELDWTTKLELPASYPGYRLNREVSYSLTKQFIGRLPNTNMKKLTHQESFTLDAAEKITTMIGQPVKPVLILPHFSFPDLVFCTNHEGISVPVPPEYYQIPQEELKAPFPYDNLLWNAVILAGRNSLIRLSTNLRGNFEMKKRQLTLLGFKVSVVPYTNYVRRSVKCKLYSLENSLATSSLNQAILSERPSEQEAPSQCEALHQ